MCRRGLFSRVGAYLEGFDDTPRGGDRTMVVEIRNRSASMGNRRWMLVKRAKKPRPVINQAHTETVAECSTAEGKKKENGLHGVEGKGGRKKGEMQEDALGARF